MAENAYNIYSAINSHIFLCTSWLYSHQDLNNDSHYMHCCTLCRLTHYFTGW